MKQALVGLVLVIMLCTNLFGQAQPSAVTNANTVVPTLVKFSGTLTDVSGKPLSGTAGVTFALYAEHQGGAPLWIETQSIALDRAGHYSVQLGSTASHGLPTDLFTSGEARWLGVQPEGQPERPRVLLLSVPYALKAADAETLGGFPPSAFMLAAPVSNSGNGADAATSSATTATPAASGAPPATSNVTTTGGTANAIPLFTTATNIQNSILTQTTTTAINVGGKLILPATGAATASKAFSSQPQDFVASVFNSGTSTAVNQKFQWQAEGVNNDKTTASGTLNLLYASGTGVPVETGLHINSTGQISFATGQTFPGTGSGTIKSVGLSAPSSDFKVSGSPVTATGTLALAWNVAPTSANTANAIVKRDASGNFSAGTINATTLNAGFVNLASLGITTSSPTPTYFYSTATNADTLWGVAGSSTGNAVGVEGETSSSGGSGVYGTADSTTGSAIGVYGVTASPSGTGVVGFGGTGVQGQSTLCCVGPGGLFAGFTASSGSSASGTDGVDATGGSGDLGTISNGGAGVRGTGGNGATSLFGHDGPGGWFQGGNNVGGGDGIDAFAGRTGYSWAGYFSGDIEVTGTIYAGTKDFKIDHPLDPANQYLVHTSVESSEMMNIYTGNVTTDAKGEATVQLQDWFEALNTDFRYQLTVIGQFAQAIVARKIENNQFQIRTNAPNVEVSWQVTGVRQDAFAKAHPLVVEEEKDARLRGFYLHPELQGAPAEKQIEWARHPEMMKQMKATQAAAAGRAAKAAPVPSPLPAAGTRHQPLASTRSEVSPPK
jgi:hypothetical protein